jgi:ribosomal protein S18 acetylase RimI-like enzyme
MSAEPNYVIRCLTQRDERFLWRMLYHAIYLHEGQPLPDPDVVNQPELARYVRRWGRADDIGFLAMDAQGNEPIGAAWLRLLRGNNRGFGYVDDATPELSVAVVPEYRGQGIGTRLLERLLQEASHHHAAVSLSVTADNPALRLYQRLGFDIVATTGTSLTMVKTLIPDGGVEGLGAAGAVSAT